MTREWLSRPSKLLSLWTIPMLTVWKANESDSNVAFERHDNVIHICNVQMNTNKTARKIAMIMVTMRVDYSCRNAENQMQNNKNEPTMWSMRAKTKTKTRVSAQRVNERHWNEWTNKILWTLVTLLCILIQSGFACVYSFQLIRDQYLRTCIYVTYLFASHICPSKIIK